MNETQTPSAGVIPVDGQVRPVAWLVEFLGDEKELYFERKPYGVRQLPLYDQAALDAAVAAATERCAKRCAKACNDLAEKMEKRHEPGWSVAAVCAMDIAALYA